MAWFYDREKRQQLEIAHVSKVGNLPIFDVTFKGSCAHCGSAIKKTFNLKMSKNPNEKKAIDSFIEEHSLEYLEKAILQAKASKNVKKENFVLFNKKTLKPERVDYETLLKVIKK